MTIDNAVERPKPSALVQSVHSFVNCFWTIGPCKDMFTRRQCINLHKFLIMPAALAAIALLGPTGVDGDRPFVERSYATAAMLEFVCHGIYGLMWNIKDVYYTDPSFQGPMSPLGFVCIFFWPLSMYYLPTVCLVTDNMCPGEFYKGNLYVLAVGLSFYILGVFYHFGADLQKWTQLQHQRPRTLITYGLFQHCRNPNYLGEILIYSAYALFSGHAPFLLACFSTCWILVFLPNMLFKEASMSRYPQWDDYVSQSGFVFFWLPGLLGDIWSQSLSKHPESFKEKKKAS